MKATSAVRAVFGCATATRDPSKARDLTTKRVVRHGLVATALVSLFLALLRGTNHRPTKMAKIHPMLPRPMETVDACWGTLMEPVESRNVKSFSLGFFQVSKERTSPAIQSRQVAAVSWCWSWWRLLAPSRSGGLPDLDLLQVGVELDAQRIWQDGLTCVQHMLVLGTDKPT